MYSIFSPRFSADFLIALRSEGLLRGAGPRFELGPALLIIASQLTTVRQADAILSKSIQIVMRVDTSVSSLLFWARANSPRTLHLPKTLAPKNS
jgi:hypothetical protein